MELREANDTGMSQYVYTLEPSGSHMLTWCCRRAIVTFQEELSAIREGMSEKWFAQLAVFPRVSNGSCINFRFIEELEKWLAQSVFLQVSNGFCMV